VGLIVHFRNQMPFLSPNQQRKSLNGTWGTDQNWTKTPTGLNLSWHTHNLLREWVGYMLPLCWFSDASTVKIYEEQNNKWHNITCKLPSTY